MLEACRYTLLLLFGLSALAPTALGEPIQIRARSIALDGSDHLAHRFELRKVGELIFRTGFVLESPHPNFGGLSGLEIDCDRGEMVAISDKGHYLVAHLARAADGTLRGLAEARLEPLLDVDGRPVEGRMRQDAEEIVVWDEGLLVSFEGTHRLALYGGPGTLEPKGTPRALEVPSGLEATHENKGLEAITRLHDGRLLAITEGLDDGPGTLAAWIGAPGAWQRLRFAITETFEPTSAATLANGDVLVLERNYDPHSGRTRIRVSRLTASQLAPAELEAGGRLVSRELARIEPPNLVDNMEGLATCPGPDGHTWIYLLSDNNFSAEQRTLLLQFLLPRSAGPADADPSTPELPYNGSPIH